MILSDIDIESWVTLITPFNKEQLNPASYDIRLGKSYIREGEELKFLKDNEELIIEPGEFLLAVSEEYFKIPNIICGQFALKSTSARKGIEHSMAGFCDPGWHGCLTMELKNINQRTSVILTQGMRIGQMVFFKMTSGTSTPYRGRYFGDREVKGPKLNKNLGE